MIASNRKRRWVLRCVLIGAAQGFAECAMSQTAPTPNAADASTSSGEIAEVVVTAEKRSESVNKVPMSISAVSNDELLTSGVNSTADLTKVVPGFTAVTSFNGTPVYYLRGVGYYDTSLAARPAVTMYADEAPIPYSAMALGTTLDLERVEVLKGPQGTLFGSNSTGGAINFIAAKPGSTFESGADFSYGRFNDTILSGFVSGPLSDTVGARVAASYEGSGTWQENYINGSALGQKSIASVRGIIAVNPIEGLRGSVTLSYTHDGSDVQVGQLVGKNYGGDLLPEMAAFPLAPANARAAAWGNSYPNGASLTRDNSELQGVIRLDYDMTPDITITNLTSAARYLESYGNNAGGTTLELSLQDNVGDVHDIFEELRAAGAFQDDRGHWIVGANYERDYTSEITTFDITQNKNGNTFTAFGLPGQNDDDTEYSTSLRSYAGFANLDYNWMPSLASHAGVRFTNTDTEFYNACVAYQGNHAGQIGLEDVFNLTPYPLGQCRILTPLPDGGFGTTTAAGGLRQNSVSWRTGLDWTPVKDSMVYVSVSRGFKAAASSDIAGVFASQYTLAPQEKLTAYEIGTKTDIVPRTHIDAAIFYYDYKDKQFQGTVVTPVFGPLNATVGIPKSYVKGVDLDLTTRLTNQLTVSVAGTYLQTAVEGNYIGTLVQGNTANFEGFSFPNTPKWQGSADARYDWPPESGLTPYLEFRYTERSGTYGDFGVNPALRIPGYGLLDGNLGVKSGDGHWFAQLWARNLTDKYYWPSQVSFLDSIVRFAGMPVTYGVSGSYRF